ncbi:MAG: hypothetical protein HW410_1879 [Nitrosarchaeum sp.]|nr:hypothetical protein [Nitrosarchaeum sp.]
MHQKDNLTLTTIIDVTPTEEKLNEAEFFLDKIKEYHDTLPDRQYYFSAFLYASCSIFDYLLTEYNKKFNLGIPNNDTRLLPKFENMAKEKGGNVLEFYTWHQIQLQLVKADPIGIIFWDKRNLNTHVEPERPVTMVTLMAQGKMDEKPLKIALDEFNERRKRELEEPLPTIIIDTDRIGHLDLIKGCNDFFEMMKNIVLETHKKFP